MSLIKAIKQQLGLSVTPANNFTLDASADNGTMKLARGNAGATTQDILTVDAAGKVAFPQMGQSLTSNGYVKLPGGLVLQWGVSIVTTDSNGVSQITFPTPFAIKVQAVIALSAEAYTSASRYCGVDDSAFSAATFGVRIYSGGGAPLVSSAAKVTWIAIGF